MSHSDSNCSLNQCSVTSAPSIYMEGPGLIYDSLTLRSSSISQLKQNLFSSSLLPLCHIHLLLSCLQFVSHFYVLDWCMYQGKITHVIIIIKPKEKCLAYKMPKKHLGKHSHVFLFSSFLPFLSPRGLHLGPCEALSSSTIHCWEWGINHRWSRRRKERVAGLSCSPTMFFSISLSVLQDFKSLTS